MSAPAALASSRRASRAEIDLDAVAQNVRHFAALAGGRAAVLAVVKANAYGHGAVMVARAALDAGARWLGVATVDEGLLLRRAGLAAPILVLAPADPAEAAAAVAADLTLAVGDLDLAAAVARAARAAGRAATVHLEVDTGMRRYGVPAEGAVALAARVAALPGLRLGGLYTHFATADEADRAFFAEQRARFAAVVREVRAAGLDVPLVHQDNSAAALAAPDSHLDLIRVGIALYGLSPSSEVPAPAALRPVAAVRSRVARVIDLASGDGVSYGRAFVAARPMRAALVPLGYADGYRRALSGRAAMLLGGRRAAVLGRVCMDQTVVAVPDGLDVRVGDEVTALGAQGDECITAEELADLAGTIAYEITTGFGARLPRHYRRAGRVVAIEDLAGLHDMDTRS
ncbi:MAG TPA: alanine racemase [Thermomicrobiales bacterium]|nr:alanine racemase [Thermomicrobiales bacterium]